MKNGPLAGLRVIALGQNLAGRLVGNLLADQGAHLVEVRNPAATEPRPAAPFLDRRKKILKLNLKTSGDKSRWRELLANADAVVENFAPGVAEALGVGFGDVKAQRPNITYLSLPGFAPDDPNFKNVKAWEKSIAAASGVFTDIVVGGGAPKISPFPVASVYGALYGATALVLTARRLAGRPDGATHVVAPLASAAFSALGINAMRLDPPPERFAIKLPTQFPASLERALAAESDPLLKREAVKRFMIPLAASYPCKDGKLFYINVAPHRRHAEFLLKRMGLLDDLLEQGLALGDAYRSPANGTNLFDAFGLRADLRETMRIGLEAAFSKRPARQWEKELSHRICCAVHQNLDEWIRCSETRQAGHIQHAGIWPHTKTIEPGCVVSVLTRDDEKESPAGDSRANATNAATSAAPLAGFKVVDFSTIISGPACARFLAELGADVIKVDPVKPLLDPAVTTLWGLEVNQGKKSILLDLSTPPGRTIAQKLVAHAGICIVNSTDNALQRMGLDFKTLHALNPELIICQITAFAGETASAWDERPGYDPVLQAATGIMTRFGSTAAPEQHGIASCVDYATGYAGAFGLATALYSNRSGKNSKRKSIVKTSLARGALLMHYPTWPSKNARSGVDHDARLIECKDGALFVARPNERSGQGVDWTQLQTLSREQALQRLRAAAYDAAPVYSLTEIIETSLNSGPKATFSTRCIQLDDGHGLTLAVPNWLRFNGAPLRTLDSPIRFGENTYELLSALGYSESDINAFLQNGVAADSWGFDGWLPT